MTTDSEIPAVRPRIQKGGFCSTSSQGWLLALVAAATLLVGCTGFGGGSAITGSGQLVNTPFNLTGFSRVAAGNSFQVDIKQGPSQSVAVTADDNLVEYLDVTKSGDTLRIQLKPNTSIRQATLKAAVVMPDLTGLNLSGATRTTVTGFESGKPLDVQLSGASRLEGDITCGEARFDVSGASRVDFRGSAGTMKVEASGASNVDLERFDSEGATVRASGASHVIVSVHGDLAVDASGASSVRYVGEPSNTKIRTSGASSVRRK